MDNSLIIDRDGTQRWYLDGKLHRDEDDLPAVIRVDGLQEWWRHGQLHRENGPAIILDDGRQAWWRHGKMHRENGPAVIWADGSQSWYLNDTQIDVEKWIKDNNLPYWETWDNVTWSLFRLEFL